MAWPAVAGLLVLAGLTVAVPSGPAQLPDPLDAPTQPAAGAGSAPRGVVSGIARQGERLVAVGPRGLILVSADAGARWRHVVSPVSTDLVAVRFSSASRAWAVGHDAVVLRSDDGGERWERVLDGRSVLKLLREAYTPAAAGALSREVDSGSRQSATAGVWPAPFLDIWFSDADTGFAVGAFGLILRTRDGGRRWEPWLQHVDNERRFHLYGMGGQGSQVFIAGEQGLLLRLNAAGDRFETVKTPYAGTFFGVQMEADRLVAFGLRGNAYSSTDAGTRWQKIETGIEANLIAATSVDGKLMLVSQAGDVLAIAGDGTVTKGPDAPSGPEVFAAVPLTAHRFAVARVNGPGVLEWPGPR